MKHMLVVVSVGLATLAGCVSVLPEPSAPDALYAIEADRAFAGLSADLIVREPEAPRLVAGQGIVSQGSDGGLRLVPGVEWSGSATRQIQLAMIGSFETSEAGNALLPEHGVLAAYELASQIKHFRLEGETAICEMLVSLVGTRDRNLIAIADVDSRKQAISSAASDRALALRDAASDCAASAAQFAIDALSAED